MALNAPVFLILLYGFALASLAIQFWTYRVAPHFLNRNEVVTICIRWTVAAILFGVGIALLGAAYLHDVWYC